MMKKNKNKNKPKQTHNCMYEKASTGKLIISGKIQKNNTNIPFSNIKIMYKKCLICNKIEYNSKDIYFISGRKFYCYASVVAVLILDVDKFVRDNKNNIQNPNFLDKFKEKFAMTIL
jgi:hypothetical protein